MKVSCIYCKNKLNNAIADRMVGYNIGCIKCPSCNKQNKRYLSEFDMILYFAISCVIYSLAILAIILSYKFLTSFGLYLAIATSLAVSFVIMKNLAPMIYTYAYFKIDYKDIHLKQDLNATKSLRLQSLLFIAISFYYGFDEHLFYVYFIILFGFIAIVFVKAYFCLKQERSMLSEK